MHCIFTNVYYITQFHNDLETLYYCALLIYFPALTFVTSHVHIMITSHEHHDNIFYQILFLSFAVILRYFRWTFIYSSLYFTTQLSRVSPRIFSFLITKYCTIIISFQVIRRCPKRISPEEFILQYCFIKFGTFWTTWKGFIFSP